MLAQRTGALVSRSTLPKVPPSVIEKAGTNLPGIPHQARVPRLYRQWLKLAVLCPPSQFAELNDHAQANEKLVITIRQKFREAAEERDPQRIRVLVHSGERSLAMFREIAADAAKRKYPETRPRLKFTNLKFTELAKMNFWQLGREYWTAYFKRHW